MFAWSYEALSGRAAWLFGLLGPHRDPITAHLGDARHAAGDHSRARQSWQQALTILDEFGHADADADAVRSKLDAGTAC